MRKIRRSKNSHLLTAQPTEQNSWFSVKRIWAIAIIALMAFSAIGYYYADRQDLAPGYRGFGFKMGANNEYLLKWKGQSLSFTYHPDDLKFLSIDPQAVALLKGTPQVLITMDPNSTELGTLDDLRFRLSQRFDELNIAVGMGVTNPNVNYPLPIITCSNATAYVPVIALQTGLQGLVLQDNCVVLSGSTTHDLETIGQRLEYGLLGVME